MKSTFPQNICYLCGVVLTKEQYTRDHVFPDCLFPHPYAGPELITLPCCQRCQKEYKHDEEYFRNNIAILSDRDNPVVLKIWEKALSCFRKSPSLHRDILKRVKTVDLRSEGGIYLGKAPAVEIPRVRMNKVLSKITYGLFCYHTGKRPPDTHKIVVYFEPKDIFREHFQAASVRGYFENVCSYMGVFAENLNSIWWLSFYKSKVAVAICYDERLLES